MAGSAPKKKSWAQRILIAVLAVIGILGSIYWYVATEKFRDTKDREAAFTLNAADFIREFQQDAKAANEKYTEKIVALNGRVTAVEAADTTFNVKFADPTSGSYAIFEFQQQHAEEAKTIKEGDSISVKGSCSGGIYSKILDATAITFKRSALNKQ